jgi:hypothetical protein
MGLLLIASGDTWPQEKFEGHGFLGMIGFIAAILIIWAIASGDGGKDG